MISADIQSLFKPDELIASLVSDRKTDFLMSFLLQNSDGHSSTDIKTMTHTEPAYDPSLSDVDDGKDETFYESPYENDFEDDDIDE